MDHKLHAASFIEEAFCDERGLCGYCAENGAASDDVLDDLLGAGVVHVAFVFQPFDRRRHFGNMSRNADRSDVRREFIDLGANECHLMRKLRRARRSLAAPEGNRWSGALRILDQYASAGFNSMNAPARASQQHDVATLALDCEIFIQGADYCFLRQSNDGVQRVVGDGAAIGDREHAASAPGFQYAIDPIAVQISAIPSAARSNAVRQHTHDLIEIVVAEVAIWIGLSNYFEELALRPFFSSAHSDDLLCQYIERRLRNDQGIEFARFNGAHESGAFDEFVARGGENASFGDGAPPMSSAANALEHYCNRPR